jgi:hypothetical protein
MKIKSILILFPFIEMEPCNISERSVIGIFFDFHKHFNFIDYGELVSLIILNWCTMMVLNHVYLC